MKQRFSRHFVLLSQRPREFHAGLARYCPECGFATVWKRREAGDAPRTVAPQVGRKLEPPKRETVVAEHAGLELEEEERVAHPFSGSMEPRVTVNLEPRAERMGRASRRTSGSGREITARALKSEPRVPATATTTAVEAIYVPARVVNIAELPGQNMFRCEVAFLPAAGTRAHT